MQTTLDHWSWHTVGGNFFNAGKQPTWQIYSIVLNRVFPSFYVAEMVERL
jgi:hypothetical protein